MTRPDPHAEITRRYLQLRRATHALGPHVGHNTARAQVEAMLREFEVRERDEAFQLEDEACTTP